MKINEAEGRETMKRRESCRRVSFPKNGKSGKVKLLNAKGLFEEFHSLKTEESQIRNI